MTDAPAPVSAGSKTLLVLKAALEEDRFIDIVQATGLPKATVHRTLGTLIDNAFLVEGADAGYQPGSAFLSLAARALNDIDISDIARPYAQELVNSTHCTGHVGINAGTEMIYLVRADPATPYAMRSRVGLGLPMHSSGMGKAVMSTWTKERVRDYAHATGLPAATEHTLTTVDALLDELRATAERGYALDLQENENGIVCVSAPIYGPGAQVKYAVSVSSILLEYPGTSISQHADAVRTTAAQISRAVGGLPPGQQ